MALTSQLVTFKKLVALSQGGPDPSLPANSAAQQKRFASRIYTVCDEIEQTGDATRTGKHRARLIATLSDCVTAKRRRRAAPAAAVTGAAARAPAAAIRTGSFGFAPVGGSLVGAVRF